MSDTPEHAINAVAKILCKENGDNTRLKLKIGTYAIKREISIWEHYIPAAKAAIAHGCKMYNDGLRLED